LIGEAVYLDSSVVVAYYLPEPISERVQALYGTCSSPVISDLVELEVIAALSLRHRIGDLTHVEAGRVMSLFNEHLEAGLYAQRRLLRDHYRWARDAISRFDLPLKSPDALHLAAAQSDRLSLITADRQLARNADALGVAFELIEP
jgi:predicted nucleic acid-binding protein